MTSSAFQHRALNLQAKKPLIFTAMSKHLFYMRMLISAYVLEQGGVPLNPFMVFDYFVADRVDRDLVRQGNNNLVQRSDELWVFGSISDGVLAEIQLVKRQGKPIRYFEVHKDRNIVEIPKDQVNLEADVAEMSRLL